MQMKTIKNAFTICISPILHLPRPPNGLCNLCFLFLMGIQSSQKKLKTMFMQNLGRWAKKVYYGRCANDGK